jgi:hypothetical protein
MRPLTSDGQNNPRVAVLFESLREEGNVMDYEFDLKRLRWLAGDHWTSIDCYSDSTREGQISGESDFQISLDENTSQIYVFTNYSGRKVEYPKHVFSKVHAPVQSSLSN